MHPPLHSIDWIVCGVENHIQMLHAKLQTLLQGLLVLPSSIKIGDLNVQPIQSALPEWFRIGKEQQATTHVIAYMIKMRWNGICTSPECQKWEFVQWEAWLRDDLKSML